MIRGADKRDKKENIQEYSYCDVRRSNSKEWKTGEEERYLRRRLSAM